VFSPQKKKIIISENFKSNICNPCIVKVPEWVRDPIGKYYLYYADHRGKFIKFAFSNSIFNNWKIKLNTIININSFKNAINHIASPEIYIDNNKKKFYLLTHSHSTTHKGQWTYVSESNNGLNFKVINDKPLAPFYLRVFKYNNFFYGVSKGGNLWKSNDLINEFEPCQNLFDLSKSNDLLHNYDGAIRHVGLFVENNTLYIFYSKIGDKPERIYYSRLILEVNDKNWKFTFETELLRPTLDFEGANLPLTKSKPGDTPFMENALRDPYLFKINNNYYLAYCVKGEFGIAIAEIKKNK
jgi:hypothetical protein